MLESIRGRRKNGGGEGGLWGRGGAKRKKRAEHQSVTLGPDAPSPGLSFSIWAVEAAGQIARAPQKGRVVASVKESVWPLISGLTPDLVIY